MARRTPDGAIILETEVDTSGVVSGMRRTSKDARKAGKDLSDVGNKGKKAGEDMSSGFTTAKMAIADFISNGIQQLIGATVQLIKESKEYIDDLNRLKTAFATADMSIKAAKKSYADFYAILGEEDRSVEAVNHLAQLVNNEKELAKWSDIAAGVSATFHDSLPIEGLTEASNETAKVAKVTGVLADALNWVGIHEDAFNAKLAQMNTEQERSTYITDTLSQAYRNQANIFKQLNGEIMANRRAHLQLKDAISSVGNAWLPVETMLVRGLTAVAKLAAAAAQNIYRLFTGKSMNVGNISKSLEAVETSGNSAAQGIENVGTSATKTAKEVKKTMASFDDIQIISSNASQGSGGASAGGSSGTAVPDTGIGELTTENPMDAAMEVSEALAYIMGVVGASLVAVGVLLLFFGHKGWGIGFIIAGAAMFGVSAASLASENIRQNAANALITLMAVAGGALLAVGIMLIYLGSTAWGIGCIISGVTALGVAAASIIKFDGNKLQKTLLAIEGVAAGALLALGIIMLVFGGATPLSIGLIAEGAILLGVTIAQIVAGQAEGEVSKTIHTITTIVTGALLVLGIILLFTPASWGLAFGLIAAGAIGLATEAALNWDSIKDTVMTTCTELFDWLKISALLVLGVVLCFSGVGIPLGLALILSGAGHLIDKIEPHWNTIKEKAITVFDEIFDWCKTWGLLVLGIVMLFTGVGIPLGLALIKKGGAELAEAQDPLWSTMLDNIKDTWEDIQNYWDQHIAKYFTAEWWGNLAKGAMRGFIKWIIEGLNKLINKINSFGFELPEVLGGGRIGFNIKTIQVPALAQGAVIPPNKEFLAVLGDQKHGTNIETPLETMIDAFKQAMNDTGGSHSGPTIVILEVDGREFGRAVIKHGNEETRRIGTKLVIA